MSEKPDAVDRLIADVRAWYIDNGLVTDDLRARWRFRETMNMARPLHWRWECRL